MEKGRETERDRGGKKEEKKRNYLSMYEDDATQ